MVRKGAILYYSVGANLGYCHNYLEEQAIAVGSFINIIRADKTKINEVYLGVALNSIVGRMQGNKEKSGIALPYLYAKNLKNFLTPIPSQDIQQQIATQIQDGFRLRKQSCHLLEVAKRAVEMAIEESEEAAMRYMKEEAS